MSPFKKIHWNSVFENFTCFPWHLKTFPQNPSYPLNDMKVTNLKLCLNNVSRDGVSRIFYADHHHRYRFGSGRLATMRKSIGRGNHSIFIAAPIQGVVIHLGVACSGPSGSPELNGHEPEEQSEVIIVVIKVIFKTIMRQWWGWMGGIMASRSPSVKF